MAELRQSILSQLEKTGQTTEDWVEPPNRNTDLMKKNLGINSLNSFVYFPKTKVYLINSYVNCIVIPEEATFYKGWGGLTKGVYRYKCEDIYRILEDPENPDCVRCKNPIWLGDFCTAYEKYGDEEGGITMTFKLKKGATLVNILDPHNVSQFFAIIHARIRNTSNPDTKDDLNETLSAMMRFFNPTGKVKNAPRRDYYLENIEQEFGQQDAYERFSTKSDDLRVLNFLKSSFESAGIRGYYAPKYRSSLHQYFHREVALFDSSTLLIDKENPLNSCGFSAGGFSLRGKSGFSAMHRKTSKRSLLGPKN